MEIEKIDSNFIVNKNTNNKNLTYYKVPNPVFKLYGVFYDEDEKCFRRIKKDIASTVSEGVNYLSYHTSGGRLRFSTDSAYFELTVKMKELPIMSHMAIEGSSGFMLVEENEDGSTGYFRIIPPMWNQNKGYTLSGELPKNKMRNYILWFPLYNDVEDIVLGLDKDSNIGSGRKYKDIKPILYYGSSITQGGCASRPDNDYQALISKWNNIDFINQGYSGNGLAEDNMVDYLASIDTSLFVCDYDFNAYDSEYLLKTHKRLYERYRAVKKDTPILFISAPTADYACGIEECNKRFEIIKDTYNYAINNGDKNVYLLDGRTFFDNKDRMNHTVDGCHPTDLGFYQMAKMIYEKMSQIDKKFM